MIRLENDLKLVLEQLKEETSKSTSKDNYIEKLKEQLREKQKEISRLSDEVKSYDPNKLRESVLEEASNHYELKIKEHLAEADKVKKQFLILHHEHTVLKCRLQNRESEFSHTLERLKVQHQSEVEQLQNRIESLEKSYPVDNTTLELKSAKHDILQLNAKLRGVLAECEELRAKNENLSVQLASTNRTYLKQHADNMSNIRTLESEKQKAVMQKEVLEKEISNFQEQRRIMNNDLQASRRELLSLRSKLEECEHKCQMMTTDLEVENKLLNDKYQSEKEQLIDEILRLKSELTSVNAERDHTHQLLIAKEQELQQNSMIARQQLWKQSSEFQQEKEKNERKFQDYKNQKDQFISQLRHEIQVLQQNLQICTESKLEIEKELLSTKEKLGETLKSTDGTAMEMLSKRNLEYEKEINDLRQQIDHLKCTSNIYVGERDRLLSEAAFRTKANQDSDGEREILQMKLEWERQKHQFHQRIEDLESQLREIKNSAANERKDLELKNQRCMRVANKLKEKLEIQKFKNEELENQKEILEKNVPFEVHVQMRNKYNTLLRRLEEYRLVVAAEPHIPASTKSSGAVSDKLLTDIKNLQLRISAAGDAYEDYESMRYAKEKVAEKPKKTSHIRKRSFKTRTREIPSKSISPIISSSSDLDLENL